MKLRHALLLCAAAAASACTSSIKSQPGAADVGEGVSYYLPKRLVRLEVERKAVTPDTSKEFKAMHLAQVALTAAEEAQAKAKAAAGAAARAHEDGKNAQPPLTPARLTELAAAEIAAKATLSEAVSAATRCKLELVNAENAYLAAAAKKQKAKKDSAAAQYEETATIGLSPYYPDENQRFIAELNHNWLRSDDWDITLTSAGLLTKADSNPSGEVDEVVIALGKVALAIFNPGGMLGASIVNFTNLGPGAASIANMQRDLAACPVDRTFRFEFEFDPADMTAEKINGELAKRCSTFRIEYSLNAANAASDPKCEGGDVAARAKCARDIKAFKRGLAYRRDRPLTISVKRFAFGPDDLKRSTPIEEFEPFKATTLMLPNGAPVEVLPFGASMVSAQKLSATFENGMLTRTDFEKPGEAQTVAGIPAAVISGAAEMVSGVLTARYKNLTTQKDTLGVEATTFDNMKKLLEAQAAYEKAQADYLKEKTAGPE